MDGFNRWRRERDAVRTRASLRNAADSDHAQYVELLYNHTLGRISDGQGYNYRVNKLDQHATNRGDLLAFFSESDENVARVAPDIHDGIWLIA